MKGHPCLVAVACTSVLSSCVATPPASTPMELCAETDETRSIDPGQLDVALVRAQAYSNEFYGEDCFVCAEVLGTENGNIALHITSPIPDMLINTSAVITVRAADGKVLKKSAYHSCHARIKAS